MKKILKMFLIINLICIMIISLIPNFVRAEQTIEKSSVIANKDEAAWKQIKTLIEALKKSHPNWNFKVLKTDLDWEDVIKGETKTHKNNVVYKAARYKYKWLCDCESHAGNWYCASAEAVEYMMDPRNSINETDVFQFMNLTYDDDIDVKKYKKSVKDMLEDTFLDDKNIDKYVDAIVDQCKKSNVNPCYIPVKIIQEQGIHGGATFKMYNEDDKKYYYNIFNINATLTSTMKNALSYSVKHGLDTIEKCLRDGIEFLANGYLLAGQDTMYFEKFDVIGTKQGQLYNHQYAQDIMYAQYQGDSLRKALKDIDAIDCSYTFTIPLYNNMPELRCARPAIEKTADEEKEEEKKKETNTNTTTNTTTNNTTTNNTTKNNTTTNNTTKNNTTTNNTVNNTTTNTSTNTTTDKKTEEKKYAKGDVNMDGKISASDYVLIKNHIMGTKKLSSSALKYADYNGDGKVSASDYVLIKNYIMKK